MGRLYGEEAKGEEMNWYDSLLEKVRPKKKKRAKYQNTAILDDGVLANKAHEPSRVKVVKK